MKILKIWAKFEILSDTSKVWELSFIDTVEPLLRGHLFGARNVAFQDGWPLNTGRNQYMIYV